MIATSSIQPTDPGQAPAWLDSMEGAGNALFQAQQQVGTSVSRLNQLANSAPMGQTQEGPYWTSRAPGTSISRWSAAFESLIEYFRARADLDYGLLKLPHAGWKWALEFLGNAQVEWRADGAFEQTSIPHMVFCVASNGRREQMTAGVVVFRDLEETGECLLLTMSAGCRWFSDKSALQTHVKVLYEAQTGGALDPSSAFRFLPIERNPFTMILEEMVIALRKESPARFEGAFVKSVSQEDQQQIQWRLAEEGRRDSELINFGSLDPRLSIAYREQAVERMEESILDYIGEPAEGTTALNRLQQLQEDSISAQQRRERANSGLRDLIDASRASNWHASRNQAFKDFCKERGRGLLDEARAQRALGQLSQLQLAMVEELISQPASASGTDRLSVALELTIYSDTARWKVAGALVVMLLDVYDEPDENAPALLYISGLAGGLAAFDNAAQLRSALGRTLRDRKYSPLLDNLPYGQEQAVDAYLDTCAEQGLAVGLEFSVLGGHVFEESLLAQLENDRSHARLIVAGQALFADAPTREQSLARLQAQSFATLAVPSNAVREAAYERVSEQMFTLPDADEIKQQFDRTTSANSQAAQDGLESLRPAFLKANKQLSQLLPGRVAFVESLLRPRLERDIGLVWPFKVSVKIPNTAKPVLLRVVNPRGGTYTAAEYRAAGESLRRRAEDQQWIFEYNYKGEGEWTTVTLSELALSNLEASIKEQLKAAEFVVESELVDNQRKMDAYFNVADYIIKLIASLDAAAAYSRQIERAYRSPGSTAFERAMILETLQAPWRWAFELYTLAGSQTFSATGKRILEALAKGHAPSDLQQQGVHVSLKTPKLTSASTLFDSPDISLVSLLFIEDQASKKTFMFLPGAPNGRVLGEYADIAAACEDLVQMTSSSEMTAYVAGCAVDGDTAKHIAYIEEAWSKSFRSFITAGAALEPTQSVPAFLLDSERIQTKVKHQKSSRSNYQVRLLDGALEKQLLIERIKQAMGFAPGIGVAVSAYDFWMGANAVVRAYLERRNSDANAELVSVMMSLVDVVGNAVPVAASLGKLSKLSRARSIARYRRAQLLLLDDDLSAVKLKGGNELRIEGARRYAYDPFEGRESLVSLVGANKIVEGSAIGTFLKDGKHYIVKDGKTFAVHWDPNGTWRLSRTKTALYEQPIVRDGNGSWGTVGSITGRLTEAGLPGGGLRDWFSPSSWQQWYSGRREAGVNSSSPTGSPEMTPTKLSSNLKSKSRKKISDVRQAAKDFATQGGDGARVEFESAVNGYVEAARSGLDALLAEAGRIELVTHFSKEFADDLEKLASSLTSNLRSNSDIAPLVSVVKNTAKNISSIEASSSHLENIRDALKNLEGKLKESPVQSPWKDRRSPISEVGGGTKSPPPELLAGAKKRATQQGYEDSKAMLENKGAEVSSESILSTVRIEAGKYERLFDDLSSWSGNKDVRALRSQLKSNAMNLKNLAPALEVKHLLLGNPTQAGVEKLLAQKAVRIEAAGKLKYDAGNDSVFRFYVINAQTDKLHAVAHFHYPKGTRFNVEGGYSRMHYKLPSEAGRAAGTGAIHADVADKAWVRNHFSKPLNSLGADKIAPSIPGHLLP